jgi:hypothetical protein
MSAVYVGLSAQGALQRQPSSWRLNDVDTVGRNRLPKSCGSSPRMAPPYFPPATGACAGKQFSTAVNLGALFGDNRCRGPAGRLRPVMIPISFVSRLVNRLPSVQNRR